jgi:3-deoxy-manno-octulosonate cytidylyltransferase (CMP-KDO synthetase)
VTYRIVIPARYGSERLPGKPLADIHGKPMIVRVADAAARSGASEVLVATDSVAVVEAVQGAGHRGCLTRDDHPSGSDRVMEAVSMAGWADDSIVINLQGDEPLMPAEVLDQLGAAMQDDPELACATLCERLTEARELTNPNVVKIVRAVDGRALYFSRAPVPWDRESFAAGPERLPGTSRWWRHIGVYAYRVWALKRFVVLPVAPLEATEKLEQLRLLENGLPILTLESCRPVPGGVDTEQDLARVRAALAR